MVALIAASNGYGYHRDELYFLEAGQHLAWGYADQPPVTPLIARVMSAIAPESLVVLRLPSVLTAGAVVWITGLLARDLGASPVGQVLAAACMAVSSLLLAVTHLLSTSTLDLLAWTLLSWLVVKILCGGDQRLWVLVGGVAGLALLNKFLVVFLLGGLLVGLMAAGPRAVLRSPWLWAGVALAAGLWTPNLIWQATHGWPQLELSRAIASGSSGTSEPAVLFVPYQLVLISPLLVPVWVAGLVRLLRDPALRAVRSFAVAYLFLAVVFLVAGGKPYYLGGLYPVLLAAGAVPAVRWMGDRGRGRRRVVIAALVLSAFVSVTLMLPVVPAQHLHATPIVDINYDAGETIGWPAFVETVADVHASLPADEQGSAIILARNYGQAGALDHYGDGLPPVYSGHNSYWYWGPPPEDLGATVIVVGYDDALLGPHCGEIAQAARIDNGLDVDNDEQGTQVYVCGDRQTPWAELWPQLRRLG